MCQYFCDILEVERNRANAWLERDMFFDLLKSSEDSLTRTSRIENLRDYFGWNVRVIGKKKGMIGYMLTKDVPLSCHKDHVEHLAIATAVFEGK